MNKFSDAEGKLLLENLRGSALGDIIDINLIECPIRLKD